MSYGASGSSWPGTLSKWLDFAGKALACLVLIGCAWPLAHFLWRGYWHLKFPFSIDYGEGTILNTVRLLATQGTCFQSIHQEPYFHCPYPPLYSLLLVPFYWMNGPQLWSGRLLSLLCTVGVMLALSWLIRRRTGSVFLALCVPCLFLANLPILKWSSLFRVDMLALFLSVSGLALHEACAGKQGWLRYSAFPVFVLAFFAKQNAVIAPAALLAWCCLAPMERTNLPKYLLAYFVPLLLLISFMSWISRGEFFMHIFVYILAPHYHLAQTSYFWKLYLSPLIPVIPVSIAGAFFGGRKALKGRNGIYLLYFVLSALSIFQTARGGVSTNYLLEPILAAWLFFAISVHAITKKLAAKKASLACAGTLALCSIILAIVNPLNAIPNEARNFGTLGFRLAIHEAIRKTDGQVLSDDMGPVLLSGKPLVIDPYIFTELSSRSLWSSDGLAENCRKRIYSGILIGNTRNSHLLKFPGIPDCLRDHYQAVLSGMIGSGNWTLFAPKEPVGF